jgi:hypothetical protein
LIYGADEIDDEFSRETITRFASTEVEAALVDRRKIERPKEEPAVMRELAVKCLG